MTLREYWSYLSAPLTSWMSHSKELSGVWEPLLGQCQITPTPTGRQALWGFLESSELAPGDEVLVAAYNFYVIVQLLVQRGLVPVFVDIDPETLCMDPDDLERQISGQSRMVLVTHMFGNPADMGRIKRVCDKHDLLLFEDCAHAVGTTCEGKPAGTWGDGALFSFGVYKLVNAFGGGMLVSPPTRAVDQEGLNRGRSGLRSWGDNFVRCVMSWLSSPLWYTLILSPFMRLARRRLPSLYRLVYPAGNDPDYVFRAGERAPFKPWMAPMIGHQVARLDAHIAQRRGTAERLKAALGGLPDVQTLNEAKHGLPNYSYFGLYVPDPEALADHLEARGISSNPHEYYNCAELPQFAAYFRPCHGAREAAMQLLRLPNFRSMSESSIQRVIVSIEEFFTGDKLRLGQPL